MEISETVYGDALAWPKPDRQAFRATCGLEGLLADRFVWDMDDRKQGWMTAGEVTEALGLGRHYAARVGRMLRRLARRGDITVRPKSRGSGLLYGMPLVR